MNDGSRFSGTGGRFHPAKAPVRKVRALAYILFIIGQCRGRARAISRPPRSPPAFKWPISSSRARFPRGGRVARAGPRRAFRLDEAPAEIDTGRGRVRWGPGKQVRGQRIFSQYRCGGQRLPARRTGPGPQRGDPQRAPGQSRPRISGVRPRPIAGSASSRGPTGPEEPQRGTEAARQLAGPCPPRESRIVIAAHPPRPRLWPREERTGGPRCSGLRLRRC